MLDAAVGRYRRGWYLNRKFSPPPSVHLCALNALNPEEICDICHLYHGPLILKASCVFGELRCVPCVPQECGLNVVFKTSLESCRNLFVGFHVDIFHWWSWEHPKADASFVLVHFHTSFTQMLLCSLNSVISNCQSSAEQRRQRNVIKTEARGSGPAAGSVLSSFSSSAFWLSILYFYICDRPKVS